MRKRALLGIVVALTAACDDEKKPAAPDAVASAAPSAVASAVPDTDAGADASADVAVDAPPPTEIIVQHILVSYAGAKRVGRHIHRTKDEAKARAEEASKRAHAGEDFTELVKLYSDDPEAQSRLGSLGKIHRDDMTPPFSDAAFKLKVGEISGVVETRFGFHIIKRNQ